MLASRESSSDRAYSLLESYFTSHLINPADSIKLKKIKEDLDFWARIDGATTSYKQEALVEDFLGKIKDQCLRVIRERANPDTLREAKKSNEELMKYVYLIVDKSKNNTGAINIS